MTGNAIPDLLAVHLQAAVPLRVHELRSVPQEERQRLATRAGDEVAEHGDVILHRSPHRGETAAAVNWLVTGLALAAYAPGGVRFGHLAWCAAHPAHRWAAQGPCGACLAAETPPPGHRAP